MNSKHWIATCALVVCTVTSGEEPLSHTVPTKADDLSKIAAKEPLITAKLSVPEKVTANQCPFTFTIKNLSSLILGFNKVAEVPFCKIEIRDKMGNKCPITSEGYHLFSGIPQMEYSNVILWLKQGEEKSCTTDLSRYWTLKEGEYTLDFSIGGGNVLEDIDLRHAIQAHDALTAEVRNFKFSVGSGS